MSAGLDAGDLHFSLIVHQIVSLAADGAEGVPLAACCLPILDQLNRAVIEQAVKRDLGGNPSGPRLAPIA